MAAAIDDLTEKEKETLRLIVQGHDAKTAARELSLSVHTINERLRSARRKLNVTSSREAARLLLEREGGSPKILGYEQLGDESPSHRANIPPTKTSGRFPALLIGGVTLMLTITTLTAVILSTGSLENPERPIGEPATAIENAQLQTFEASSRNWLALVDSSDWAESFKAAGKSFREVNTVDGWAGASRLARVPLGKMIERNTLKAEFVAAPPMGYAIIHFQTRFEVGGERRESITLEKEDGVWKVVGYVID